MKKFLLFFAAVTFAATSFAQGIVLEHAFTGCVSPNTVMTTGAFGTLPNVTDFGDCLTYVNNGILTWWDEDYTAHTVNVGDYDASGYNESVIAARNIFTNDNRLCFLCMKKMPDGYCAYRVIDEFGTIIADIYHPYLSGADAYLTWVFGGYKLILISYEHNNPDPIPGPEPENAPSRLSAKRVAIESGNFTTYVYSLPGLGRTATGNGIVRRYRKKLNLSKHFSAKHPDFYQFDLGHWGILPGNYSAITHVDSNVYAIVDDKRDVDGFALLTLDINPRTGRLRHAELTEPEGMLVRREQGEGTQRDCEGVCYHPIRQTFFVSDEGRQEILEYGKDGYPTGVSLDIPLAMRAEKIMSNRGFEALTYDTVSHRIWTTTEYALPADTVGMPPMVRLIGYAEDLRPDVSYLYPLDGAKSAGEEGEGAYGVAALLAMGDGRLLVLEREAFKPQRQKAKSYVDVRLYIVNPAGATPVALDADIRQTTEANVLHKQLLYSFTTRVTGVMHSLANYEGMCWGPTLSNGRRTLLLIADSQKGYGNKLYHLHDYLGVLVFREEI